MVTFLLALLVALVWSCGVSAQSWDYVYEGNDLPDDIGIGVFKTDGIATSEVCEITDPDDKVCFFLLPVDNAEKATVEARVRVLSQSGSGFTILLGIEDGAIYTWLDLFPDHVELDGGETHDIDMTDYHILRIARDGDSVSIYVDNEEVITGAPGGTGDRKNIIFGSGSTGGTGEHYWDYVAFTTQGAFAPLDLPAVTAVTKAGKQATKWAAIKAGY